MARPAKQADQQRPIVRSFRLTAAELAALDARVAGSGLEPAEFMRWAVLSGRVVVRRAGTADPRVVARLLKIGVNLNQLARTANTHGQVPPDLARLCRVIEEIVMKAVGPGGD